jgi:MoaA/NifB/PqqE/SkfB family radical SAM enzyme
MARMSQVSSVLITGKGEPCLNIGSVLDFTHKFREFPVELQTNGIWLSKNLAHVEELATTGMNVIAVSVDHLRTNYEDLSKAIHKAGMLFRVCFNIINNGHLRREHQLSDTIVPFADLLYLARIWGADQLTLRKIVAPNHTKETSQSKWIAENCDPLVYIRLVNEMKEMCQERGHHLRSLPYGAEVFDLNGVAVSYSDYCVQDDNNTEDIRSLILQEDGHVYTSWNSTASTLF